MAPRTKVPKEGIFARRKMRSQVSDWVVKSFIMDDEIEF